MHSPTSEKITPEFGVLGPLRLAGASGCAVLRGPKLRKLFTLLLVRAQQVVPTCTLIEELWDERPPRTAAATMRTHVYHLRQALAEVHPGLGDRLVTSEAPGYLLDVSPRLVDSHCFAQLTRDATRRLDRGDVAGAGVLLDDALALWRGPVMADVSAGAPLRRHIAQLEEAKISALEAWVNVRMRLGHHRGLVSDLRDLVTTYPLHEWFHARYMEALYRSDRRGEALQAYRKLHTLLAQELGIDPSAPVRLLHREILTSGV